MNDVANSRKQSKPLFDPTINYGHVLTALSIVIAGTGAYYGMSVELHNVDQRVAKIEATLQQLANVVVLTARQDERLIAIGGGSIARSSHQGTAEMRVFLQHDVEALVGLFCPLLSPARAASFIEAKGSTHAVLLLVGC